MKKSSITWAILIIIAVLVVLYFVGSSALKDKNLGNENPADNAQASEGLSDEAEVPVSLKPDSISEDVENLLRDIRGNTNISYSVSEPASFGPDLDSDPTAETKTVIYGGSIFAEGILGADISKAPIYLKGRGFTPDKEGSVGAISEQSNKSIERYRLENFLCNIGTTRVSDDSYNQNIFCGSY